MGTDSVSKACQVVKLNKAFKVVTPQEMSTTLSLLENHFISLIHNSKTIHHLKQIHAHILLFGLLHSTILTSKLISSSSFLNSLPYSFSIFHSFPHPSLPIFNTLIRALCDQSQFHSLLSHFSLMFRLCVRPNRLTFPFAIKAAIALPHPTLGLSLHTPIVKLGIELDSFVRLSLVDMYAKFRSLDLAFQLFDETPTPNKAASVLLWNVLINGCCRARELDKARVVFEAMPERTSASWNVLINGFVKEGALSEAWMLFDRMPEKNVISWTTMVAGCFQNGDHECAISTFYKMLEAGIKPNDFTVVSTLSACSRIGALDAGVWIHEYVLHNGFQVNKEIGTALVEMYAKCGEIKRANRVFHEIRGKDLLTWSVMISGWAIHGRCECALFYFEEMKSFGIRPDEVVFLAVLMACSHAGLVDRGLELFNSMIIHYSMKPSVKHYACIVDLFGRAGRLQEAVKFIDNMDMEPDFVIWGALFCACRAHKNIEMAQLATERLLQLEPKHPGSYVFLSNIYAAVGRWEDAERVRTTMKSRYIEKHPGWSFIEVQGCMHKFVAGDRSHALTEQIYKKLEELTSSAKERGYVVNIGWVLHNIEEEEKEDALGRHSEKLALVFGLITTPNAVPIRIVKNLRICGDCHSLMKYASSVSEREIVLRDIKRFHHFKDGACTCGDYW